VRWGALHSSAMQGHWREALGGFEPVQGVEGLSHQLAVGGLPEGGYGCGVGNGIWGECCPGSRETTAVGDSGMGRGGGNRGDGPQDGGGLWVRDANHWHGGNPLLGNGT
jgi:hypothetical protein